MQALRAGNRYFDAQQPWTLKPRKTDREEDAHAKRARLDTVLYVTMEAVRVGAVLLQPVIPDSADKFLTHIGVPAAHRTIDDAKFGANPPGAPFAPSQRLVMFPKPKQ